MSKKKEKTIRFTREEFNEIRKMDRNQVEEYVNDTYTQGFEKGLKVGQEAAGSFDLELAMQSIGEIKGIGQVKLEQIKLALIAAGAK